MERYITIEYPKWLDGVLVQSAADEQAHRAVLEAAVAATRTSELACPPSPANIRMRRTRERRREGKLSIRCEISTVQIEAMVEAGLIDPAIQNDPAEVSQAVGRSLDRLTRSGAMPNRKRPGIRGAHDGQ